MIDIFSARSPQGCTGSNMSPTGANSLKNTENRFYQKSPGFMPARLVYVNAPSGPGSAEGVKAADINVDNIGQKLLELQEEKNLSASQISAALEVINQGDKKKIAQLVRHAKELADGSIDNAGFALRLKVVTGKAPEATPATPETPKPSEEQATKEDIEQLQLGFQRRIDNVISEVTRLSEIIKSKTPQNPELARKMEGIAGELNKLKERDKNAGLALKQELAKLYKSKKITREEAYQLFDLPPYLGDGAPADEKDPTRKQWYGLTAKLSDEDRNKLKKVKLSEEKELKTLDQDIKKLMHEFRDVFGKMSEEVLMRAAREKSVENLAKATGLALREGQVLTHLDLKDDGTPTKTFATIKDITFAEIKERDEHGNVISKKDTSQPVIVVEMVIDGEKKTDTFNFSQFLGWVESQGVTEKLDAKNDLEASIGESVKVGDKFEFRYLKDAGDYRSAIDEVVQVKDIAEGKDDFGNKTQLIYLDKPIMIRPTANEKKSAVTFGEFAKWYKREEVLKPITSLTVLRSALLEHNETMSKKYPQRDPAAYPPIEVKVGEVLKYDDGKGRMFVIKEADDNHIKISTDDPPFTLASFLRWVKDNEVEKVDTATEAKKEASHIEDEAEREAYEAKLKHQKDQQILDKIAHDEHEAHLHGHDHGHGHADYSTSYLSKLWMNTHLITPHNLFEMGKTIYELIKRKLHRREHGAIGVVGEKMFSGIWTELGAEFKGVAQHAENEEVNHHVEHFKTMGIETVKHELHTAPTKDILKAAITALADKGQLRWDDPGLWERMNYFGQGVLYDEKGNPLFVKEENHLEAIEKYLDFWFGQDTFREFRNKQDSSYNSIKKNFEDNAKRLEGDPQNNGGLLYALQSLLYKHLRGEYVNPAEYEEYLHFAIQAGKLAFEDKLFFLVMGIGAESPGEHGHAGQTLLHIDRVGAIESELLNNFPILDFFTERSEQIDKHGNKIPEKDEYGNIKKDEKGNVKWKKGKPTMESFRYWLKYKCLPDLKVHTADELREKAKTGAIDARELRFGKEFTNFFQEEMAWNEGFRTRLEKASRDGTNFDHDDLHVFGPLLGEETIQQITQRAGGSKQAVSNIGLRNTIAGFGEFMKVKMNMLEKDSKGKNVEEAKKDIRDILDLIRSFVRFDAIIDRRYLHEQKATVVRLGPKELGEKPLVDPTRPAQYHLNEIRTFIGSLATKCGIASLWREVMRPIGVSPSTEDAQKQSTAVATFGKVLESKLREFTPEQTSAMFKEIQEENEKYNLQIKGIPVEVSGKIQKEVEEKSVELHEYIPEDVFGKVEQIKTLQGKVAETTLKSTEEIKAENRLRLRDILKEVEEKRYVPREGDIKILNDQIAILQKKLQEKESGQPMKEPLPVTPSPPLPPPSEEEGL